ncbi:diguanylate cyclase [Rhodoferax sp.]|uniref:sensor domain-containing diguanylate cyclase n=1 Tax=Rhodoferax sp. TaxID=50421 RepID=UPI0025DF74C4|nr:diguanylate cyclase [Rhodoferax sp.]MCM2341464.1 diguanylate cyclase [Rhodoferax sp.]
MKRFSRQWRVWLLLAIALLTIGVLMGLGLLQARDRIQEQEREHLRTQTKVVEDNLARQLTTIHRSLLSIQQALPRWQSSPAGRAEGQQTLINIEAAMSSVRTFAVLDARGTVTFSNREELLGRNFYQRDYVQVPLQMLDPKLLYVSPPFKSVLNTYLISLARVLLDSQGQFAGVVVASVEPGDMAILLNSVRYSDDMQAMLVHGDGKIFLSEPNLDPAMAQELLEPNSPLGQHLRNRQTLNYFSGLQADNQGARLTVMHTIAPANLSMDKPLIVVLDRSQDKILAVWQRDVVNQTGAYLVLVLISSFGLSFYQSQRSQKIMAAKRLKLATEASGVGIWEFDLITKSYQWDDTMYALFGMDPKAASPRNDGWIKLLAPPELQRMREATRATIQQNQPFGMTFQIRRPDGQVRAMHNRAALYSDEFGVPRRLIGATEDVTERMAQEAELRVAAATFESHESMLVTNAQVEILRVNPAFTALFGYTSEQALGRSMQLIKSGRHDADFYKAMWAELVAHHRWQGEVWNVRKEGVEFPCWLSITAVRDDAGVVTHYVATHTDITLRKEAEDEVKRLAFFDPLTNLPNRRLLADRLHQALVNAKRSQGHAALIFLDLDKFKPVNDRHGHAAGDQLLQAVAHRLRTCVRESDTVARVGGDEFVVLLPHITLAQDALQVAEKMHARLRAPFHLPTGQSVLISSSAGVALYPEHGLDEAALSHHADVAMYTAKAAGRDQYVVYEPALDHAEPVATPETPTAQTPHPKPRLE